MLHITDIPDAVISAVALIVDGSRQYCQWLIGF